MTNQSVKFVKVDQNGQAIMPEMGQDRFTWEYESPVCNNGINHSQDDVKALIEAKQREIASIRIDQWRKIATAAHYAAAVAMKTRDWNTKKQMIKIMEDAKLYSDRAVGGIFGLTPPDPMMYNVIKILLGTDVSKQDQEWAKEMHQKDRENYLAWKKSQRR